MGQTKDLTHPITFLWLHRGKVETGGLSFAVTGSLLWSFTKQKTYEKHEVSA